MNFHAQFIVLNLEIKLLMALAEMGNYERVLCIFMLILLAIAMSTSPRRSLIPSVMNH